MFERWRHKWYGVDNRCTGLERSIAQTNIGFGESQGAFYVLVMGLVLSVIFFLGERYLHTRSCQVTQPFSRRHQNNHAAESKAQEINGLSVYKQNGLDHSNGTVATDAQLCRTDTAFSSLDEGNSMPQWSEKCNGNDAFGLSGVYSKVFAVSNIDNLPSTSNVETEIYHKPKGESKFNYNTMFSSTSDFSSPLQEEKVIDGLPDNDVDKHIYYTLTSECTQL